MAGVVASDSRARLGLQARSMSAGSLSITPKPRPPSLAAAGRSQANRSRFAAVITSYVLVGIVITFYNKHVLSGRGFKYEISMIMVHSFSNSLLSTAYVYVFLRAKPAVVESPYWPSQISYQMVLGSIFPVGMLLGFDITLTNLAFRLSSVAVTEIVKSGIPVLVLAFGVYTGQEQLTVAKLVVILVICVGIILTTFSEVVGPSVQGIVAASAATACGALKLVLMQRMMRGVAHGAMHPMIMLMYMAPCAFIALIIPFVLFEADSLSASEWVTADRFPETIRMLGLGGLFAFALNIVELVAIQVSSALSLCVAGVIKLLFVIAISAIWMDFHPTFINVIGCIMCLCGVVAYNCMRMSEITGNSYLKVPAHIELDEFDIDSVMSPSPSRSYGL